MHTRWTPKTDRLLARAGLTPAQLTHARAHRQALCEFKRRPPGVQLTPLLAQFLYRAGCGPDLIQRVTEHLDALADAFLGDQSPASRSQKLDEDRQRKAKTRAENRDAYNLSQKLLMRQRRASAKKTAF